MINTFHHGNKGRDKEENPLTSFILYERPTNLDGLIQVSEFGLDKKITDKAIAVFVRSYKLLYCGNI